MADAESTWVRATYVGDQLVLNDYHDSFTKLLKHVAGNMEPISRRDLGFICASTSMIYGHV